MNDIELELVPIGKLKLADRNPNQGDVGAITESIKRNGWMGVIVANKRPNIRTTNMVVAGNHRLKAAQALDIKEVPVHWVDKSDEEFTAAMLADNRAAALSLNDENLLAELLEEVMVADLLDNTLFDSDDLDAMLARLNADDRGNVGADTPTPAEQMARYEASGVRAVMLPMTQEEFDIMAKQLDGLRELFELETNTQVVQRLVADALS